MEAPREGELRRAADHIARAKAIVARQRQWVAQLEADGQPSQDAKRQLHIYETTLECLKHHERLLRDEAKGRDKTPAWLHSRIQALGQAHPRSGQ